MGAGCSAGNIGAVPHVPLRDEAPSVLLVSTLQISKDGWPLCLPRNPALNDDDRRLLQKTWLACIEDRVCIPAQLRAHVRGVCAMSVLFGF